MKLALAALAALAAAACASTAPVGGAPAAASVTVETLSATRFRVTAPEAAGESNALLRDRAMLHAAELTLKNGEEWFEIAGEVAGDRGLTLIIVTGSGETLAGGSAKTHDARETVRRLGGRPELNS
jgi:hypothetical protein